MCASDLEQLFALLASTIERETPQLVDNGICVDFIGRLGELPASAAKRIASACATTAAGERMYLHVAFNYAGRTELVDAIRAIVRSGADPDSIDEASVAAQLYTAGTPDPDLLIRTGGEERLSNFLLWQLAYTELHISPLLWPDFGIAEFYGALLDYQQRDRRFGRVHA